MGSFVLQQNASLQKIGDLLNKSYKTPDNNHWSKCIQHAQNKAQLPQIVSDHSHNWLQRIPHTSWKWTSWDAKPTTACITAGQALAQRAFWAPKRACACLSCVCPFSVSLLQLANQLSRGPAERRSTATNMQLHARDVWPISVSIPAFYVHATQHFTACPPALAIVHHLCSLYMFLSHNMYPWKCPPIQCWAHQLSKIQNTHLFSPLQENSRKNWASGSQN